MDRQLSHLTVAFVLNDFTNWYLTHQKPPRRFFLLVDDKTSKKSMTHGGETARTVMLFFEVLPFTDKEATRRR